MHNFGHDPPACPAAMQVLAMAKILFFLAGLMPMTASMSVTLGSQHQRR